MKLIRFLKGELAAEASEWVDEGLLPRDQASAILARYNTQLPDGSHRIRGYLVLCSLAAVMGGVGVILLLSHNWEEIPRFVRLGGIGLFLCAINAMGVRALWQGNERVARIWLLFGSIWYGAAIFLVGQIYHLGEHYLEGLLLFWGGVLPLALLLRDRPLAWLSLVVSSIWMALSADAGQYPWLFVVALAALGALVFIRQRALLLFMALAIAFGTFLEVSLYHLPEEILSLLGAHSWSHGYQVAPLVLVCTLFLGYHQLSLWLQRADRRPWWSDYGVALEIWSLRFFLISLAALSFTAAWEALLPRYPLNPIDLLLTLGSLGLCIWLLLRAVKRLARRLGQSASGWHVPVAEAVPVVGPVLYYLLALAAVTAVSLSAEGLGGDPRWLGFAPDLVGAIVTNVFALGAGIWLIYRGVSTQTSVPYYTGIVLLLAVAACRYFDLIGDYIGAAILFFVAAAVLLLAARVWRRFASGAAAAPQLGRAQHAG